MLQFRQIKERITKELTSSFPQIRVSPLIKKSSQLQPIFKVIACPPLSPSFFKSALENLALFTQQQQLGKQQSPGAQSSAITSTQKTPTILNKQSLLPLHEVVKKSEQYFTACINILEHNQRVRQAYEGMVQDEGAAKEQRMKEVREVLRAAGAVKGKREFLQFVDRWGCEVMGMDTQRNNNSNTSMNINKDPNTKTFPAKTPSFTSNLSFSSSSPTPLYLPLHPDQYSFITPLTLQQYLLTHQQTLQTLLIYLNTVAKLSLKLSSLLSSSEQYVSLNLLSQLKEILEELSVDQLFCRQDNRFSQVVRFVLGGVDSNSRKVEKWKNEVKGYREQLKQAMMRAYFVEFVTRRELDNMVTQLVPMIRHSTNHSLQSISNISSQLKQITDYLFDKQQTIFKPFYDRKIKKVILKVNEVWSVISLASKMTKRVRAEDEREQLKNMEGQEGAKGGKNEKQTGMKEKSIQNLKQKEKYKQRLSTEISRFNQTLTTLQQQITTLLKSLQSSSSQAPHSPQTSQLSSTFTTLFNKLQRIQLTYIQLSSPQHNLQTQTTIINDQTKRKIFKLEKALIAGFKTINMGGKGYSDGGKVGKFWGKEEDDVQSVVSEVSNQSKASSVFVPYQLQQSDVILDAFPTSSMTKFPTYDSDQLLKEGNEFITNQFLKNQTLLKEIDDRKNVNLDKLANLIYQIEANAEALFKLSIKPVETEQKQKPQESPSKNSKSPQKGKQQQKGRPASKQKSPLKGSPSKNPPPLAPNPPASTPQTIKRQSLLQLRTRLLFIRQSLLPTISQPLIHKIFQHQLHLTIFQKLLSTLQAYRARIFTSNFYQQAQRYGFLPFIEHRVRFVTDVNKNLVELKEIFGFVQFFSQQKVKFEATEESTYEVMLRALLAMKEVLAYRRQNPDLGVINQMSLDAVRFLEEQVYAPFVEMFRGLVKLEPRAGEREESDQAVVQWLEGAMDSVKRCVSMRQQIESLVSSSPPTLSKSPQQLTTTITTTISTYPSIPHYPILRYKKLESMIRTLRAALLESARAKSENKLSVIRDFLKRKLEVGKMEQEAKEIRLF